MTKAKRFLMFFIKPCAAFTAALWVTALALLGFCIAEIVLETLPALARISLMILTTLLLLYALYATALLIKLPQKIAARAEKNKHLAKFISSYNFRTVISACGAVLSDSCFAVFEISIGFAYGSHWFRINGVYYLFLCAIRISVILFAVRPFAKTPLSPEKAESRAVRAYAGTGIAMLVLNSLLYTLFDVMLAAGGVFVKHSVLIYGAAIFTFYKIVFAVGGFIKSRTTDNLVTKNIRNLGIVTALVSVLTFQTSLLATFPEAAAYTIANGTTATIISFITIALALSMIIAVVKITRKTEKSTARRLYSGSVVNDDNNRN